MNWVLFDRKPSSLHTYRTYDEAIDTHRKAAIIKCQQCGVEYPHPRGGSHSSINGSTHNVKRHRDACPKGKPVSVITETSSNGADIRYIFSQVSQEQFEELLMRATVASNWPFTQFVTPAFQELLRKGFPKLKPPSPRVMRLRLERYANQAREEIRLRFGENNSRISLVLDCWTSPNHLEFMGTYHPT